MAAAQVLQVPRAFHANFASSWRRYLYLFPLQGSRAQHSSHEVNGAEVLEADGVQDWEVWEGCGNVEVDVQRVDEQLRGIRGQALHFTALAYKEVKNLGESEEAVMLPCFVPPVLARAKCCVTPSVCCVTPSPTPSAWLICIYIRMHTLDRHILDLVQCQSHMTHMYPPPHMTHIQVCIHWIDSSWI